MMTMTRRNIAFFSFPEREDKLEKVEIILDYHTKEFTYENIRNILPVNLLIIVTNSSVPSVCNFPSTKLLSLQLSLKFPRRATVNPEPVLNM